jgi:hypothetical protein
LNTRLLSESLELKAIWYLSLQHESEKIEEEGRPVPVPP